jgi:putative hydrolase of the HAD superfamily
MKEIRHIVFDWGDTLMRDFPGTPGPMYVWDRIEVFPNAALVLEKLSAQFVLTVASNAGESDTADMRKALVIGQIDHYFRNHYTSKDLGVCKPDPAFFTTICAEAGFDPAHSVLIGNDYKKDIVGAKAAGLTTILVNHAGVEGPFELADYVVSELKELLDVLL